MEDLKQYFVFMCPKCRHFTLAPVGQKSRRCSFCGNIINITKAAKALFDTPDEATAAVKAFNARGSDDFEKAVERSRERIRLLVPTERIDVKTLSDMKSDLPPGKAKRLMHLLKREADEEPISLGTIEDLCEKYQLDWSWVESQLTKLSNAGVIIFPRPWTVQLVPTSDSDEREKGKQIDVSKDIIQFLRMKDGTSTVQELIHHFEDKGVSRLSVEASLAKLMRDGEIYEPRPDSISLIN